MDEIRNKLVRKAIGFEIGGFAPSTDPFENWLGKVNYCEPGEEWPTTEGKSMHALCQINLTKLPYRPSRLDDIEFISMFIGPDDLPSNAENGKGWCIRAYKSISNLIPLKQIDTGTPFKPFQMRPVIIQEDFPCWEDVQIELPDEIDDKYYDLFKNVGGFKLGGWPTLIQSEIYWAPLNKHPASPEYVFQIDSNEKCNLFWGDGGVAYFGRGTAEGKKDVWTFEWQCN